jgi:Tol biopolymer transport system component
MEQKKHTRREIGSPETTLSQYLITFLFSTAHLLKCYSILVLHAIVLIVFTSCIKDDDNIIDQEYSYGTVELLKSVGQSPIWSPLWAPAGEKIAYNMDGNLFVMNSNGSDDRLLTSLHFLFTWSPSATELAFLDYREIIPSIYKIGVDGNNKVRLTDPGFHLSPSDFSWSPDGAKIVYTDYGNDKIDMYIMNSDGSGNQKIDVPVSVWFPSFTPNGNRILFSSLLDDNTHMALFLVGTDGRNLKRLEIPPIRFDFSRAVMKHDESKIYFSGEMTRPASDIFEVNADGSGLRKLTKGVGSNSKVHLSPDGRYISFQGSKDDDGGICVMHADGSRLSVISKGEYISSPGSWSPDSKKLIFIDEVNGVKGIYVLTLK